MKNYEVNHKCNCGSMCITGSYFVEETVYCRDCFYRIIQTLIDNRDLAMLKSCLSSGDIYNLGIKYAYLRSATEIGYVNCHFDVTEVSELNPRIDDDKLLIDLWFKRALIKNIGVLDSRVINGKLLVKQTLVINELDYLTTANGKRYYW